MACHCKVEALEGVYGCWRVVELQEHCERHSTVSYASGSPDFAGFGAFEFATDSIGVGFRWACSSKLPPFLVGETTRHAI